MNNEKLGRLFEKASLNIFIHLFETWGYESLEEPKRLKSGTQFGFDLYFKIKRNKYSLNIFIECKASKKDNTIPVQELIEKSKQLDWANFSRKDIHIYFSPTRAINLPNNILSLFDATLKFPFVVIDWMRKTENYSKALFLSYDGQDEEILEFKKFLLDSAEIETDKQTPIDFTELSKALFENFHNCIDEAINLKTSSSFDYINSIFWEKIRKNSDERTENLYRFYIKTDSTPNRLKQIIANGFNISNSDIHKEIKKYFTEILDTPSIRNGLIKITSAGGTGKSTFLFDLAQKWYLSFNIFIINEPLNNDDYKEIQRIVSFSINKLPTLFLIDNFADFASYDNNFNIKRLANRISEINIHKTILIIFERRIRLETIGYNLTDFQSFFDKTYQVNYGFRHNKKRKIFNKIIRILELKFSEEELNQLRKKYLFRNRSISESTFELLKTIDNNELRKHYRTDWDDWDLFVKETNLKVENLYPLVATFYQFGLWLTIEFCANFLEMQEYELTPILVPDKNLPIYSYGSNVCLRHETLANWYFENTTKKKIGISIFKKFLKNISSNFEIQLFVRVCRNKEFEKSFLASYLDEQKKIEIIKNYVDNIKEDYTTEDYLPIIHLAAIYRRNKQFEDAYNYLEKIREIDKTNFYLNLELCKLYRIQDNLESAEKYGKIAVSSCKTDNNFDLSRAHRELGEIFLLKGDRKMATEHFRFATKNRNDVYAGLRLGKLYIESNNRKVQETAIQIFRRLLEIDGHNLRVRIELIKAYLKMRKIKLAIKTLNSSPFMTETFRKTRFHFADYFETEKQQENKIALVNQILALSKIGINNHEKSLLLSVKGDFFKRIEEWNKSIDCYEESNSLEPSDYTYRQLGYLYYREGDYSIALEYNKKAIKLNPQKNAFLYYDCSRCNYELSKFDVAKDDISNYYYLCVLKNQGFDKSGMEKLYNKVLTSLNYLKKHCRKPEISSLERKVMEKMNDIGLITKDFSNLELKRLIDEKKYKKAMELCSKKVVEFPKSSSLHITKGNLHKELGQFKKSENLYQTALKLSSSNDQTARVYNNIALLILQSNQKNRYEEGIMLCDEAIKTSPKFKWSYETKTELEKAISKK